MSDMVEIGRAGELEDRTMKEVLVSDREVLLARVGGSYYAADNRCPHMGGPLSDGKLHRKVVTCPLHGSQVDLRNGQVVRWLKGAGLISRLGKTMKSPRPLTTYKVRAEEDKILVEI